MSGRGFTPVGQVVAAPAGSDATLTAQVGACGDGCRMVFFAWNDRFLGTDAPDPSAAILGISPAGAGAVSVTYAGTSPDAAPVTITYTCNASRCYPSSWPPPGHPMD